MIDPKPGHSSASKKVDHKLMRGIEHFRQFHPDCRQIIHVEKAAAINFLSCNAPECQAIRLGVEQLIEPVKTARGPSPPRNLRQSFLDRTLILSPSPHPPPP